jgi:hypothetical protein
MTKNKIPKPNPISRNSLRYAGCILLLLLSLYHLEFAYGSVNSDSGVQAIPALISAFAFGYAMIKFKKGLPVLALIFWGTLPFFLVHIPMTILLDDEDSIFLIGSAIAPAITGTFWLIQNRLTVKKFAINKKRTLA